MEEANERKHFKNMQWSSVRGEIGRQVHKHLGTDVSLCNILMVLSMTGTAKKKAFKSTMQAQKDKGSLDGFRSG